MDTQQMSEIPAGLQAPDTKAIEISGQELYDQAMQLQVVDEDTLRIGDSILGAIKSKRETFEPGMDKKCEEAFGIHRFLTELRKRVLKPFVTAELEVKRKMGNYHFALEEKRRKEEARLAAQAQKEAEEARKKEIEEARKAKDKQAVAELKAAPIVPVVKSLPKTPEAPKLANTSFRDAGYGFRIDKPHLVPKKYWKIDEKSIQSLVDALGANHGIPGIVVFRKAPTIASKKVA